MELFAESIFLAKHSDDSKKLPQDQTISLLDKNLPNGQLVWGLETAVLTDDKGKRIKEWGSALKNLNGQVQRVLKMERPVHTILCGDKCHTVITITILSSFELVGTLSLGRSLADGMIEYQEATNTDIVILTRAGEGGSSRDRSYKLSAMTHSVQNTPLLQQLRQHHSLDDLIHENVIFPYGNGFYNIQAHPMEDVGGQSSLMLIVDEITSEYNKMRNHFVHMVFTNLFGLMTIFLVLFFLLNALLKRVDRLSAVLPFLAKHEYQKVRLVLDKKKSFHYGNDEIDNLIATAREVTDQLEQLKKDSQKKTLLLTKNSQALKKEKDFIQKLVQTAPILIVTQTCS